MFSKGVSRRWMVNTIGVVFFILLISITTLSLMVKSSTYNSIEQTLNGRADELLNWLSSSSGQPFTGIVRDYIAAFQDKNQMEIMALDQNGQVFITSTGFEPDHNQEMPDYETALQNPKGEGQWIGTLNTGEKAMAITRVIRDENGGLIGSVRYLVSMERADQQITWVILLLVVVGIVILLLLILSGVYFIRSILVPVRQLSQSARQIAQGDFAVRIDKAKDDEIGDLCDAINDMAGELGASEQLKNDFISSVSHELRTPLTAIKGWAETLQEGADPVTTEKGMNVIIRESERLSGLVEELLDFSRMQNGRMTLMMEKIDLLAELGEAVYMFSDRAEAEHKFLLYEEPAMLSPVLGDINRLRQVFVNIIDNALKYTAEGGTVEITAKEQTGFIRVVISDNGCGIPAEHLPNVKKKFYKANQTVRGSGIGLALADEIMKLHGGQLDIESHENVGTAVTITIPVLEEEDGI